MTTRRLAVALLCTLLAASAGCSGLMDTDNQPSTATTAAPTADTTTAATTGAAAPTTSGTTTETPEQLAPGVTTGGVTDALALATAHQNYVRTHAFVKHSSVERTNGTESAYRRTTISYANESKWRWSINADGMAVALGTRNGTFVQYADGERVLYRYAPAGESVRYNVRRVSMRADRPPIPPSEVLPVTVYERSLVYSLVGSANATVERADDAAARVSGSMAQMRIGRTPVTNVEFTAIIAENGVVQSLDLTYEQNGATYERSITFDASVTDPVERPDWYETAVNQTEA